MADHNRYIEPFCGSAAVFFNKNPVKAEVLNDIDGNIVHFFKILREKPEAIIRYLEKQPYSFEDYVRIKKSYYSSDFPQDDVQRAAEFYFLRYSQFGGGLSPNNGFARRRKSLKSIAKAFKNSIQNLDKIAHRLKDAMIEAREFQWVLNYYDHQDALFYCDPPYRDTEHQYPTKMMDHNRLLDLLAGLEGKFILSYDHEIEDTDFFRVQKHSRYSINRGGRATTEYLYMNYNPKSVPLISDANQTKMGEWV
jgi:DNA adenine methylase